MVLVGPSGCGKSTTLRMVAGLEEAPAAKSTSAIGCVNDVAPAERDIAMVFQNYALYPHMSRVSEHGVRPEDAPHAEGRNRKRVREAAAASFDRSAARPPAARASGGQRQRVALGRAIVREPKVFLFDEPLSNLDAKLRVQMRAEIAGCTAAGDHDHLRHARSGRGGRLGNRIVLMENERTRKVVALIDPVCGPACQARDIGTASRTFVTGQPTLPLLRRGLRSEMKHTHGSLALSARTNCASSTISFSSRRSIRRLLGLDFCRGSAIAEFERIAALAKIWRQAVSRDRWQSGGTDGPACRRATRRLSPVGWHARRETMQPACRVRRRYRRAARARSAVALPACKTRPRLRQAVR